MIGDDSIKSYLAALASKASTPGGGAAAGISGAQAAGLIAMVAHLTRDNRAVMEEITSQADAARENFVGLAEKDMQCFDELMKVWKSSAKGDGAMEREASLQQCLRAAASVPLEMLDEAVRLITPASKLVEIGNANLVTDAGIAASLLESVIYSSRLNVTINLNSIEDEEFVRDAKFRLASTSQANDLIQAVKAQVDSILNQDK